MALRRVRSKSEPKFESIASDEEIERFPDMWEQLEGEPQVSALLAASAAAMAAGTPTAPETKSAPASASAASSSRAQDDDFH